MSNDLLLEMLYVSVVASVISSQTIQKIKQTFNLGNIFNKIISVIISVGIGFCYALSFYTSSILYALWIGIFTLVGAEGLYKSFKGSFGLESASNND